MNSDEYVIRLYSRHEWDFATWYVTNLTLTGRLEFSCLKPTPMSLDVALKIREKLIGFMINNKDFYFKSATIIPFEKYKKYREQ